MHPNEGELAKQHLLGCIAVRRLRCWSPNPTFFGSGFRISDQRDGSVSWAARHSSRTTRQARSVPLRVWQEIQEMLWQGRLKNNTPIRDLPDR